MYPVLFRPFGFPISTFGVMMAVGFLIGTWIVARRFRELKVDPDLATTLLIYVMLGGVAGSKLYYAIDVSIRTAQPFLSLLLSRDGITWYGGFLGGVLLGWIGSRIHGLSFAMVANAVVPALAVGQALGRVGCFLVGDDYGHLTDLPWGIAFPLGTPPTNSPVHPTQLYECLWLFSVAGLLWRRRFVSPFLSAEYLLLAGAGRFVVEIWRTNPAVAGLTEPQWIGIALILIGGTLWVYHRRGGNTDA